MNLPRNLCAAAAWICASLALALSGCAPGEDSASPAVEETASGTVNVLFTDAPTDDFSAINITISRIELLPFGDDDSDSDADSDDGDSDSDSDSDGNRPSQRAMLFSGDTTFDLLRLENFTSLFSVTPNVPHGEYHKIRLTVSALELIDADTDASLMLDVPADGKIDLLSRNPFLVEPDTTLLVTIDIDAERSIHVSSDDDAGYRFRPVVFVSVNNAPPPPGDPGNPGDPGTPGDPGVPNEVPVKFVRVQGYVNRTDLANGSFGMQVPNIGGEQFDIALQSGAPVILSNGNPAAQNFEVSDNLSTAVGSFDANDPSLFQAVILNVGFVQDFVYETLRGVALDAPVNGEFHLALDGGGEITVQLHPLAVFYDNAGAASSMLAIDAGTPLEIDARPLSADGERQEATLVVALTADAQPQQQMTGQIVSVAGDAATVATDLGDRCVSFGTAAISVHTDSATGIDIGPGAMADVQTGSTLDAVGIEGNDGCLQAQSVMVFTTEI